MSNSCLFCGIESNNLKRQIIKEFENYYIIYDGFPVVEPHLLIIPKKHYLKYAQINISELKEVQKILIAIKKVLPVNTFFYEHGEIGQTVQHAHMHAVRFNFKLKDLLDSMNISGETISIEKITELKNYDKYFLFIEKDKIYIFRTLKIQITPGIITDSIAKLLKQPFPANKRTPCTVSTINNYKDLFLKN